jgi:hypothetical protein
MAKKIYQAVLGTYGVYHTSDGLDRILYELGSYDVEFLQKLRKKRARFFDKVILKDKQRIHRPPIPNGDPLIISGSWGLKFILEGPKWPIRKILKWKRPKKKKWLNNKRVYS